MSKLYFPFLVAVLFLTSCAGFGKAHYKKGMKAYDAGDFETALLLIRESAWAGYTDAQYRLAFMLSEGLGTNVDYEASFKWSLKAAEQGNTQAMHNLGVLYANGEGVEKDVNEAAKWFRKAADLGATESMVSLGDLIRKVGGSLYPRKLDNYDSKIESLGWYEKAAVKGDPWGLYRLAKIYEHGMKPYVFVVDSEGNYDVNPDWRLQLIEPDFEKALRLYKEAAAAGSAEAQSRLGTYFMIGEQVNLEEALNWFRLAAAQDELEALLTLGWLYYSGERVEQDYAKALGYYLRALAINDSYFVVNTRVGLMYLNGWGTDQDIGKALTYLEKGSEKGFEARLLLGSIYARGEFVTKNNREAYKWYKLASEFIMVEGQQAAIDEMERLKAVMTEAEVAEAEALAQAWQDEKYPGSKKVFGN